MPFFFGIFRWSSLIPWEVVGKRDAMCSRKVSDAQETTRDVVFTGGIGVHDERR